MPFGGDFSFELPDDVFYDGQIRPAKTSKKPKKRAHAVMDSADGVSPQDFALLCNLKVLQSI